MIPTLKANLSERQLEEGVLLFIMLFTSEQTQQRNPSIRYDRCDKEFLNEVLNEDMLSLITEMI